MVIEPKLCPDTSSPSAIVLQPAKHISFTVEHSDQKRTVKVKHPIGPGSRSAMLKKAKMTMRSFSSAFPLALEALDTSALLCVSAEDPEAIGCYSRYLHSH